MPIDSDVQAALNVINTRLDAIDIRLDSISASLDALTQRYNAFESALTYTDTSPPKWTDVDGNPAYNEDGSSTSDPVEIIEPLGPTEYP